MMLCIAYVKYGLPQCYFCTQLWSRTNTFNW